MKNIYVLSTPNPSRLCYLTKKGKEVYNDLRLFEKPMPIILDSENQNIYITSDEEIKEGDYAYYMAGFMVQKVYLGVNVSTLKAHKKIILTTDQDLIKDGVKPIPDEFLEWFVKNPSCEEVEVENIPNNSWGFDLEEPMNLGYKIIIPKEKPKQDFPKFGTKEFNDLCYKFMGGKSKPETLEEVDENKKNLYYYKQVMNPYPLEDYSYTAYEKGFIEGYQKSTNYQQDQDKNRYSDEEIIDLLYKRDLYLLNKDKKVELELPEEWFEQFKKK